MATLDPLVRTAALALEVPAAAIYSVGTGEPRLLASHGAVFKLPPEAYFPERDSGKAEPIVLQQGKFAAFPLLNARDRLQGVLCLHDPKLHAFDPRSLELLRAFGLLAQRCLEEVLQERAPLEAARNRLVSPAVHLIRGALTNIHGFSEFLLNNEAPQAQRQEFLGVINEQAGQLAAIVTELADLFRIESGTGRELKRSTCDVSALAEHSLKASGVPRRIEWQPLRQPLSVSVDVAQTQHALCALMKAVAVEPTATDVLKITAAAETSTVTLLFSFPPSCFDALNAPDLFEPFHFAKEMQVSFAGDGLALARHLIEAQGGRFEIARDIKSKQIRFEVSLPLPA